MADNINNVTGINDADCMPLAININRLNEIKAMEESEQRLIDDLFSIQVTVKKSIPVNQRKPPLVNKKTIISNAPK